jgi:uncharacterized protein (UPF0261 family)
MSLVIAIVGTLDTKGEEIAYLRRLIEERGHRSIVIDCGILGKSSYQVDVGPDEVARAAGETLEKIRILGSEAKAVERMAAGVTRIVSELHRGGKVDGILALGGTMGTFLGLSAMKALPIGVPKVMLSTVALTPFIQPEMAPGDLVLISTIVDFWGLNSVTKRLLEHAAGVVVGAAEVYQAHKKEKLGEGKELVAITTMGTSVCKYVTWLKPALEKQGYEVLVFHTIGVGGRFLEQVIAQNWISGVLDLATNELINEICGGSYIAGPDRLETAGKMGIPQVISVGGFEAFGWGKGMDTLPSQFRDRKIQLHSKLTFAVKASKEEMAMGAKLMAEKLNKSRGPTVVILPMRGFSERDKEGGVFYDPEGREVFREALKAHLNPKIKVIDLDLHINDQSFAEQALSIFNTMMEERKDRKEKAI